MNAVRLLRQQLKSAHDTLEMTMADVTNETAQFTQVGKSLPVGAAYAHAVVGEDVIVSKMLAHKDALSDSLETGLSRPMPNQDKWQEYESWSKSVTIDLNSFRSFAQEVYKATDDWLGSLTEEDLDKPMEGPMMGEQTLGWFISNFIILHIANLTGEISAAKGIQGLRGYPF